MKKISRAESAFSDEDLELFASLAGTLAITDDLSVVTFLKDEAATQFFVSTLDESFFEDEDLPHIEKLIEALETRGLASSQWSPIEDAEREDGDSQFTWTFEIPLAEDLGKPEFLDATRSTYSVQSTNGEDFASRWTQFFIFSLERIFELAGCNHSFPDLDSVNQECSVCGNNIWSPREYLELFSLAPAISSKSENPGLPKDLSDIDGWPAQPNLENVLARISELSISTFSELMQLEIISPTDAVEIARQAAAVQASVTEKIRWLECPLLEWQIWPDVSFDGWHADFLELMWEINTIISAVKSPKEASTTFQALMPRALENPVSLATILALKPKQTEQATEVIQYFLSLCALNESGHEALNSENWSDVDCMLPLLAIACLYPGVDSALLNRAVKAVSQPLAAGEPESTGTICSDFWDYILWMLIDDRESSELYCPNIWWRDGFYAIGIPDGAFQVDMANLLEIAKVFVEHQADWSFENAHGDDATREHLQGAMSQVIEALA